MKKAKMFLAAVAVIGVVGGAFAFKASKFGTATYFVCDPTALKCTKSAQSIYSVLSATKQGVFQTLVSSDGVITSNQKACSPTTNPCGFVYGNGIN